MTRKEQAELTRKKIIEAAKELNQEKQISEISVEDITKKANVSKGSFYTYFNKKEDVVEESLQNTVIFLENLLKTKEKRFVEVGLHIELMKIINLNLMKKLCD